MIRRDINRLNETVERHKDAQPALAAICPAVLQASDNVNKAWQDFQAIALAGNKEREERDSAIELLIGWIQRWRPVVLLTIPGADANIKNLPSTGATPDDVIRVAEDMAKIINDNPGGQGFRESTVSDLGTALEDAKKETADATAVLPAEAEARSVYSEACLEANPVLTRGLEIVRATFGRTSPEYKQFIARAAKEEEEEEEEGQEEQEIEAETAVGL
jgi:hypothetical protein